MLILHRMTQLGVMTQKRPEIWVSYPKPHEQALDMASVSIAVGDHKLWTAIHDNRVTDGASITFSLGDHKLYDPTQVLNQTDEVSVSLGIGNHIIKDSMITNSANDDIGKVALGIGDQKLYAWGVRAENLDDANAQVSLAIGDHKLYEE